MARILLIDGDNLAGNSIGSTLESKYFIEIAKDPDEGLFYVQNKDVDLIIISHSPQIDSLAVCKKFRHEGLQVPILLLTNRTETHHKIAALLNGADDYLVKPINKEELLARIKVLLRRPKRLVNPDLLEDGDLIIDLNQKTVTRAGQIVHLRRKELYLLEYLMRNKGRVVSREMILSNVWPSDSEPCQSAVNVHIKNLRDRIDRPFGNNIIHTVYGIGYKLVIR